MPIDNSQKRSIEISTIIAIVIVAAIVAAVSVIATIKYYEATSNIPPAASTIPRLTPSATPAPTLDGTADWKTYRNEKYRFEFKYPNSFAIEEPVSDVAIVKTKGKEYLQFQYLNTIPPKHENYMPNKASFIGVANINDKMADKYYTNNPQGEGVAAKNIPYTDYVLVLGARQWIQIYYYGGKEIGASFEKIISTFKFIEKNQTADWNVIRDEKAGYEFKYPKNLDLGRGLPPRVIVNFSFKENDIGTPIVKDKKITVAGEQYSLTIMEGFAAGSTYRDYYYTTNKGSETFSLYFPVRYATDCKTYAAVIDQSKCEAFKSSYEKQIEDVVATFRFTN